jgi:high-affinity iron transporter
MALIIGIVIGMLRKIQRSELNRQVWMGVFSAALVSLLFAFLLQSLGASLSSPYEELFEGVMMLVAAAVLTWMIFWMQRQSRFMKSNLEADVRQAQQAGGMAVFGLAFVAVLREGVELAIFFTAASLSAGQGSAILGALAGLAAAALLGWGLFASTIRLNLRGFFNLTSLLLILFAAGLAAHGIHEFIEIGLFPALIEPVWNTSPFLPEDSQPGVLLKTLFGYNDQPALSEVLVYLAYFLAIAIGLRRNQAALPKTT